MWPPDTISAKRGKEGAPSWLGEWLLAEPTAGAFSTPGSSCTQAEYRWPSRWLMPYSGNPEPSARPLAMVSPTMREPGSPGPRVTAMASRSASSRWACASASATTVSMTLMWWREATSGKTPPYFACSAAWEATTLENAARPFSTTAAAVSSQEVSMPRMRAGASFFRRRGIA